VIGGRRPRSRAAPPPPGAFIAPPTRRSGGWTHPRRPLWRNGCRSSATARRPTTARRALLLATAATLAAVAIAAGGCGEDGAEETAAAPPAQGVGPIRASSSAQFADCRRWRRGSVDERYATIAEIRGQLTSQDSPSSESDLPDEVAYEIFEKTCSSEGSDRLRLYKLYAPAQAFAPLRTDIEGE
jgi:hypothetical protein